MKELYYMEIANEPFRMKNEIRSSIAIQIESIATTFLNIHDSMFKFSLHNIFRKMDFIKIGENIANLLYNITYAQKRIDDLKDKLISANFAHYELNFVNASYVYYNALKETVILLNSIVQKLNLKTNHLSKYPKKEYDREVNIYFLEVKKCGHLYDNMAEKYSECHKY